MKTAEIIQEIERLPADQRMLIIERILHSMRLDNQETLLAAVERLYDDYKEDKDLIEFTQLDGERFYEVR